MTRAFSKWVGASEKKHLTELLRAAGKPVRYRKAMHDLGRDLGEQIARSLPPKGDVLVVCTVEDADFLARGVLEAIEATHRVALTCFWNERKRIGDHELAPIIGRYEEPYTASKIAALVVLKSIISGACVVRTNLLEVLDVMKKRVPIFVAAPVLHVDALAKLEREFPVSVVRRMTAVWCARDSQRTGNTVVPGIGGTVYELLGLGTEKAKNRVWPEILDARLDRLASV